MTKEHSYNYIAENLDIESFIDYLAAEIYCYNTDWFAKNMKFWNSTEYDGKWRFFLYDLDGGFRFFNNNLPKPFLSCIFESDTSRLTILAGSLIKNERFKNEFLARTCDLVNTAYSKNNIVSIIDSLENIIKNEIPRQQMKWEESCQDWKGQVNYLKWWAGLRPDSLKAEFIEFFNLEGITEIKTVKTDNSIIQLRTNKRYSYK